MKKYLGLIRDYLCSCGIDKEEYRKIKKEAYISNFLIWKYLHMMLCVIFAVVAISAYCFTGYNTYFILSVSTSAYCLVIWLLFMKILKDDSLVAQLVIYLTMMILLTLGVYSGLLHADMRAVTFEILLVMLPMAMIDKPYFMAILLSIASVVYIVHVYFYKTGRPMTSDISNTVLYCVLGIMINIFYNSIRIREFVATKTVKQQRDCDMTTGLLNKVALMNQVNERLNKTEDSGAMLVIDIDKFRDINIKYGHSIGDQVLGDIGNYINELFPESCVKGRFSGDVFAVFIQGDDAVRKAEEYAERLIKYTNGRIHTSNYDEIVGLSIGVAEAVSDEFDYDTLFKKADIALLKAKENGKNQYAVYRE